MSKLGGFPCYTLPNGFLVDKYKTLVVRKNGDLNIVATTKTNFVYLFDIELMMGLTYIMLMLEVIHVLIKFVQGQETYVCDFMTTIKIVLC